MGEKNLNKDFTNTRRGGGGGHYFEKVFSKFLYFLNDGFPYLQEYGPLCFNENGIQRTRGRSDIVLNCATFNFLFPIEKKICG